MLYAAYAEILTLQGNAGAVESREEIPIALTKAWQDTGTWAAAIAANDADEPMLMVASIDANGDIFWDDGAPAPKSPAQEKLAAYIKQYGAEAVCAAVEVSQETLDECACGPGGADSESFDPACPVHGTL